MGKVNAYLPDDLEAEAREVGVEWSPVFQQAVRHEVKIRRRLASAETARKQVAERLLRSKHAEDQRNFDLGHEAGVSWAEADASFSELDRLRLYFERPRWTEIDLEHYPTIQRFLFNRALGRGYEAEPDWFTRLDSQDAFDQGFLAGAKQVYEAVADLLNEDD